MSGRRILWRTNRKLSGLEIDAPISKKAWRSEGKCHKFESCRVRQSSTIPEQNWARGVGYRLRLTGPTLKLAGRSDPTAEGEGGVVQLYVSVPGLAQQIFLLGRRKQ